MSRTFGIMVVASVLLTAILLAVSLSGGSGAGKHGQFSSIVAAADSIRSVNPQYVGSMKCRICHLDIYKSWQSTKHAKALSLLSSEHRNDSSCVGCHITGFKRDGTLIEDVGCEACHGPGSEYRKMRIMKNRELAVQHGLVLQAEAVCVRCHNEDSPDFKGFDYSSVDMEEVHLIPTVEN